MARPPITRRAPYTSGEPPADQPRVALLPNAFPEFLRLQRELAATELGFPLPEEAHAEGDLAGSVMEMSALVAHVLGLYQNRYGNETFLGTARSAASLVKHGRRLGYESSPGLSAWGYLALFAKAGLSGTLPERFAFSSAAVGEKPPQDYELSEPAPLDASLNALLPRDVSEAMVGGVLPTMTLSSLVVSGVGLDLDVGEVIVVAWHAAGQAIWESRRVVAIEEDPNHEETQVQISAPVTVPYQTEVRVLAKPDVNVAPFGYDAPTRFDTNFTNGLIAQNATNERGYAAPPGMAANDIFLDQKISAALIGQPVVRVTNLGLETLRVAGSAGDPKQKDVHVQLRHVAPEIVLPQPPNLVVHEFFPSFSVGRTVTRLNLLDAANNAFLRLGPLDRISRYLSDWQLNVSVRTSRPSEVQLASPLVVEGEHAAMLPGKIVAIEATGGDETTLPSQIARVTSSSFAGGATTLHFQLVDVTQTLAPFRLGYLRVLGNVAKLTHGKSVHEVLGDSDGVSAFQRLTLAKTPLAYGPSALGPEPQLEVRVGGGLFRRVLDFEDAGPNDPVYLVERDEAGLVSLVFADGLRGAIPPPGKRHIEASYRKGIGALGNADARAVHKIAKAHAVLDRAFNPTPIAGGVDPASPEDVRTEAPLYLATFDRAVSVQDHAKLARRFPGVARAAAYLGPLPSGVEGVRVIIANRGGVAENALAVAKFLRERRDNTLPLSVEGPAIVDVSITLAVSFDPAFDEELVKLSLRALLAGNSDESAGLLTFATRDLGQPLFLSQLVEWVERLPGIAAFRVEAFAVQNGASNPVGVPPAVLDTVKADPNEWVRLLPANLTIEKLTAVLA